MTNAPSTITFADGLVGFPGPQEFALTPWGADDGPFALLESADGSGLAFVVVPPAVFFGDYAPEIDDATAAAIDLTSDEDALLLVIVTVPGDVRDATANLLGPLLINLRTSQGVQAVLNPDRYPSRRPLLAAASTAA